MNDIDRQEADKERRHKILEKLINRALKLVETPSPQIGWFLAVPYKSEIVPEECGVELLSNLTNAADLMYVFEGIVLQCLAAGLHPKPMVDNLVRCVSLIEEVKGKERRAVVVPGNFGKN